MPLLDDAADEEEKENEEATASADDGSFDSSLPFARLFDFFLLWRVGFSCEVRYLPFSLARGPSRG